MVIEYKGPWEGWSNWATWNVALWFDNDYALYVRLQAYKGTSDGLKPTASGVERFARHCLGPKTRDGADLSEVNWEELAEHWGCE